MSSLPTGTVTFLFTDIEDSTGVLHRLGSGYGQVLEQHAALVREAVAEHGGVEVSTEGDSFFVVFSTASAALAGAAAIQRSLHVADWPQGGVIRVRIGVHTGHGELGGDNYVGLDVHRAARIESAGHGGQVVVSEPTRALATAFEFMDLGRHRLKGIEQPEQLYQLVVDGLPQTFPPLRSLDARPNNLPPIESRIIGRETEAEQVKGLIEDNRLVTITGPGGIGKTRLALEVATEALPGFDDGAFLVDLAPVTDPDLVLPTIGATVGVANADDEGLAKALRDGPALLVLDNLEQVASAAPALGRLLAAAPPLKLLGTSQVPLRLAGEQVYRLEPLAVGGGAPAVDLFVTAARRVDPAFDGDAHAEDVAALVTELDGVPLAVELAAARVNVLTPAEILHRVRGDGGVLKSAAADAPDRHRSLTAAIAWSFDLLTPGQREVLMAFAPFRGGAGLAALEAVVGRDALDDLGELVDRSLVRSTTGEAGKRFGVLAPVHLFVQEHVGDDSALIARHTEHFFRLAMEAKWPLEGDERARWGSVLGDDHQNLQVMLERLLDAHDTGTGFEVLGALWRYFQMAGRLNELALWLDRFFALPEAADPTSSRAWALMAYGAIAYWRRHPEQAVDLYREAVGIADTAGDPLLRGHAWYGLATSLATGEQWDDAFPALEVARSVFTDLADQNGLAAVAAADLFMGSWSRGEAIPPRDELLEMCDIYEAAGQTINAAQTLIGLSARELLDGDPGAALDRCLASIDLAQAAGDSFVTAWAVEWAAAAISELGDPERAARIAGAAAAARERIGGGWTPSTYGLDDAATLVRRALGEEAAEALLAEGAELTLFDAVELARQAAGS